MRKEPGGDPFTDLRVRVQPRASRSEIVGKQADALKVRISAPPVDGSANEELVRLLARALGISRSHVEIRRGTTGRSKTVRIRGLSPQEVAAALGIEG